MRWFGLSPRRGRSVGKDVDNRPKEPPIPGRSVPLATAPEPPPPPAMPPGVAEPAIGPDAAAAPAKAPPAGVPSDDAIAALGARRGRIRRWWDGTHAWDDQDDHAPPVGLALSGGGIRSATFSIGLLQGLAKSPRDALSRIDVLSTVSGGGYAGGFFRSLFVPGSLRGIEKKEFDPADPRLQDQIADQYRLARAALGSRADARKIEWQPRLGRKRELRNPIWWLREHSRYLAPSGPTDYSFAAAYIARNWLAMVYLFVLACAALATPMVMLEALLTPRSWTEAFGPISPLLTLAGLFVFLNSLLALAYWATQAMSTNEPRLQNQKDGLRRAFWTMIGGGVIAIVTVTIISWIAGGLFTVPDPGDRVFRGGLIELFGGGAVLGIVGALVALAFARWSRKTGALLTAEIRLKITTLLSWSCIALAVVLVVALIDTLGANFAIHLAAPENLPELLSAMLLPLVAYLIKKVPDWLGGSGGSAGIIGTLLSRFASKVALVLGLLLYGVLAVGAVALVHHFAWTDPAAPWASNPRWPSLFVLLVLFGILAVISGRSTGFINLSSLHALYSARLTRAFFGGSNTSRLILPGEHSHPRPVTTNHRRDYIQPSVYGSVDLPAPIHIINVTLNQTIDPRSQIVARDRKGDIMTVEPGGIRIGNEPLLDWHMLANDPPVVSKPPENISLGQWIAISGAAASAAMGRMTNLGYAVAFSFANVRLGYWWHAPGVCRGVKRRVNLTGFVALHFGTFVYLFNEISCRYSRSYDRKYLTDGGHYENSGAYVLVRRRVPLIIVSDNGADPKYEFEDLQTLVRQVRIDMGGETTVLEGQELHAFLGTLGAVDRTVFVDPARTRDWKARMTDPAYTAYVLVLRVAIRDPGAEEEQVMHLVWIKPRLLPDLPADVRGYAEMMKPFPQQPTGDQFFDEAQWESYRRLGEESMRRLLEACPKLLT